MSVKLFRLSYMLPAVALAGLAFAPACGGDDDDPTDIDATENDPPDASEGPDASEAPDAMSPDAMPEAATRAGTIAITELALSSNPAVGGSNVTISFADLTTATVEPAYDDRSALGTGCVVHTYDLAASESPPTTVSGGDVTVTGTAHDGFACPAVIDSETQEFLGYLCNEAIGTAGMGTEAVDDGLVGAGDNLVYTIEGADLDGLNLVGSAAQFIGFDAADAAAATPGLVAAVTLPNQVTTQNLGGFDSGLNDANAATMADDGIFGFLVGEGPFFPGYAGIFNFLDDGTADVVITKPEANEAGAIDVTLQAAGEGFTLDDESAQPHALPTDGSAVTFSCGGTNGDCGVRASGLDVLVVSGSANNDPDGNGQMPATALATFQCAFGATSQVSEATIPADAMAAVVGISPTTIETTVIHAAAQPVVGDNGRTNVLVGHGVVGITTVGGDFAPRKYQPNLNLSAIKLRALAAQR